MELRSQAAALVYRGAEWSRLTTLSDATTRWLGTLGDGEDNTQAPQTVERYARIATSLVLPRLGAVPIGDLTALRINTFMSALRVEPQRARRAPGNTTPQKTGYSSSYRLQALMLVKEVLDYCVNMGAIEFNPALSTKSPKRKVPVSDALTKEQVEVLRRCVQAWETTKVPGRKRGPHLRSALGSRIRLRSRCCRLCSNAP